MTGASVEEGAATPRHVAIIMDGNGRWAARQGLPRVAGHRAGAEAVRKTLKAAVKAGVECLTLYAFSSENWRRSEEEVTDLKGLMRYYLERELDELAGQGVRLDFIGDPSAFGPELWKKLEAARDRTRDNDRLHLVIALNYGSRAEIVEATRAIARDVAAGNLDPDAVDETHLDAAMQTAALPPLDLLIRTSGEIRLSNFLLWQAAYAELMFVDTLWPDFDGDALDEALAAFSRRQRRYGGR
ncbi:polyprenyl diphosphate synthase [Sphingomicrobium lutaoense]|uniref:Isoprenyl transferase n=1 Tax=Sphingomicrobium lutaoense TaxID=515949 RepID=A0A839Z2D8_9SPHN|nr:polyprenyl diphosphate synthase [Sphingomicrobium lutaoense]MBB3763812.1 undecaprenyl diphosphate synthase [Sphingomicrobium lutaoense]